MDKVWLATINFTIDRVWLMIKYHQERCRRLQIYLVQLQEYRDSAK